MPKPVTILLFAATLLSPHSASAQCTKVPMISFDIELYMPESEATIESRAQQVRYAPTELVNIVFWAAYKQRYQAEYQANNVRATLRRDDQIIYIDRFGWIRSGEKYGKVDAKAFANKLLNHCPK